MKNKKSFKRRHVLPNFIGIGGMRCGTSWLYQLLRKNTEIYLCPYVKEIYFFDHHYQYGLNWYEKYFPTNKEAIKYNAIGEISPGYLLSENVPKRVLRHIPEAKFIVILRNPINRAFSHYKYNKLNYGFEYNFREYLKINSSPINHGLYYKFLKKWFNYFPRERFLFLIFEEVMNYPYKALRQISEFLNINYEKFNKQILAKKVNPSYIPRFHKIFTKLYKIRQLFEKKSYYRLIEVILKFKRFYSFFLLKNEANDDETIDSEFRNDLYLIFKEDIENLEKLIQKELSIWKV